MCIEILIYPQSTLNLLKQNKEHLHFYLTTILLQLVFKKETCIKKYRITLFDEIVVVFLFSIVAKFKALLSELTGTKTHDHYCDNQ